MWKTFLKMAISLGEDRVRLEIEKVLSRLTPTGSRELQKRLRTAADELAADRPRETAQVVLDLLKSVR